MHGTGGFTANTTLAEGGRVCLLESRKYDPVELLDTVEREKVNGLVIVGDPFSRPLLAALDEHPGQLGPELADDGDLVGRHVERAGQAGAAGPPSAHAARRRVQLVGGARHGHVGLGRRRGGQDGVVHARPRRQGADRGRPAGGARLRRGGRAGAGRAQPARLLQGRRRSPTAPSRRSTGCATPSRATSRRSTPTAPSTCSGRGSVCINSGGEKIFPEEVEEALKTHDSVRDAVVVGIPHPTYGEQIVAVVEPADGVADAAGRGRADRAREGPPGVVQGAAAGAGVTTIGRAPNGKVDYKRHRAESIEEIGAPAAG